MVPDSIFFRGLFVAEMVCTCMTMCLHERDIIYWVQERVIHGIHVGTCALLFTAHDPQMFATRPFLFGSALQRRKNQDPKLCCCCVLAFMMIPLCLCIFLLFWWTWLLCCLIRYAGTLIA